MSANNILPPQYDPRATEAKWQTYWEDHQIFQADPHAGDPTYSIVIPPPNVTGSLHMGHAFNTALLDTLVRYHRMLGHNTLCLPGTDHASIAVQTILERQIRAEGKTREEVGRDRFLHRAWEWKAESGGRIVNQLRRLGLSADWTRERFTMDTKLCEAVLAAFVQLHEEGLIYRGNYMVNWCPASQSAVSDLEVEPKEVEGHLWHFRYPLTDGSGYLEVATTRPETMLGDTGVAVNPSDERYSHLIGKTLMLPIMNREIPIIADELVDPEFGTGCVKVTPAHDPNDFEMGQRHNLPMINIMNKDGTLNAAAGEFAGEDRFEARRNVVKRLEELGALVKIEPYRHTVPHSDRGKVPIEPLLSTQWFVRIETLAKTALTELDEHNSPQFVPSRWTKVYRDWLVKLKDWCISRQLWWGHQIPAWYAVNLTEGKITDHTPYVVAHDEAQAWEKAKGQFGPDVRLMRDPDVLDTWFSSGLWPFSTLGWPEQTADLAAYFPNSTLVTGFDIIFFWVARMTMMSGHFMGQMPFKDVYIHGLVRDENGKKMSKSANNGIDPLILIEKYGADAVRYTLIREVAGAGQDISLQYDRATDESESVEASRNFANKLWNAARFVQMNLGDQTPEQLGYPDVDGLELSDRWILSRFYQTVQQTRDQVDAYGLGEAAKGIYEFIWGDFCDWYIELVKPRWRDGADPASQRVAQQTLAYVLEGILKLLHPFMPHVTEEIWHTLTQRMDTSLGLQPYPVVDEILFASTESPVEEVVSPEPEPVAEPASAETPEPPIATPEPEATEFNESTLEQFINQNQSLLITLGIVGLGVLSLKILLNVLAVINGIPLVGSTFRLIGLLFVIWFVLKRIAPQEQRATTWQIAQHLWNDFFGMIEEQSRRIATPKPPAPVATEPETASEPTPEPVAEPVTPTVQTLVDPQLEADFALLIGVIRTIRNLRAEADIKPGVQVAVRLQSENPDERRVLEAGQDYIANMAKAEKVAIAPTLPENLGQRFGGVFGTVQILIPLQGVVDINELRDKLQKKLAKIEKEISSLQGRLQNENFVSKAPEDVVAGAQAALVEAQTQAEILRDRLEQLQ